MAELSTFNSAENTPRRLDHSPQHRHAVEGDSPIQEAMNCLHHADRRLRRGKGEQTDEVLNLLQSALQHLQQAADEKPIAIP